MLHPALSTQEGLNKLIHLVIADIRFTNGFILAGYWIFWKNKKLNTL